MKYCKYCNKKKEDNQFFIRARNNEPYGYCKECVGLYTTERFITYKKEAVDYLGGKCIICGYNKYIGSLEFHHINPKEKSKDYYKIMKRSFKNKKEELDKCVLLCSNCHKEVENGITVLDRK